MKATEAYWKLLLHTDAYQYLLKANNAYWSEGYWYLRKGTDAYWRLLKFNEGNWCILWCLLKATDTYWYLVMLAGQLGFSRFQIGL